MYDTKYRKPFSLALALVLCFGLFTGCTQEEKEQPSASPSASASQSIEDRLKKNTEEYEGDDPNKLTVYFSDTLGMVTNMVLTERIFPKDLLMSHFYNLHKYNL